MGFASLGSGSSGNATIVAVSRSIFLVDCGFKVRTMERRLSQLDISPGDIDAIFITHEHSDHISGLAGFAHKYNIKTFASYGTQKKAFVGANCSIFDADRAFEVDGVKITPVRTPHDAREPTQFIFEDDIEKVGVLTDIGKPTSHVLQEFESCTHLLLEANHDERMLANGSYPQQLKRRISGDFGHLSNAQALHVLERIYTSDMQVRLGHISEQNNSVEVLTETFRKVARQVASLEFANQKQGFNWVGRRPMARQVSFDRVV